MTGEKMKFVSKVMNREIYKSAAKRSIQKLSFNVLEQKQAHVSMKKYSYIVIRRPNLEFGNEEFI